MEVSRISSCCNFFWLMNFWVERNVSLFFAAILGEPFLFRGGWVGFLYGCSLLTLLAGMVDLVSQVCLN